ncbi:MAG: IS1380 family transposase [Flavobacteriales bacterium]|nr:IS1380 family transposase [Flavobacteriales bacterium]
MKILSSPHISAFGGLNFVIEELDRLGVGKLLENDLPPLPLQSRYCWRDTLYSFWSVFFCGGDCAEDLSGNFKAGLSSMPFLNLPSPDRVLQRMKELARPKEELKAPRGRSTHEFSMNDALNTLNLRLLKKMGSLDLSDGVLDYDNTILFTRKADARMTYKKNTGYCPGVGIMGSTVVYVENRNGNSDAQTLQRQTLHRMFCLLERESISISAFRADSASYQFDTMTVINKYSDKLYIRARMNETLARAINQIDDWEEIRLGKETVFRGETQFTPFASTAARTNQCELLRTYRLVVTKLQRADRQINVFTGEACNYSAIVTSDYEMSRDEVVIFYNQRGKTEREFDVLKNDFGWNNMPFSHLEENTVFLILTAICRNIYAHIIHSFSIRFKGLRPNFRIKKFIFRFICIPAKWLRRSREHQLRIYGHIGFKT